MCAAVAGRHGQRVGRDRGEHDRLGSHGLGGAAGRADGRVAAEVRDAPAELAQRDPERDEPERVVLAGDAREHRPPPAAAAPAPRPAQHPALEKAAGVVLLRDRRLAALPAVAELAQVGQHHVAQDHAGGEDLREALQVQLRRRRVEALERGVQRGKRLAHVAHRDPGVRVVGLRGGLADELGGTPARHVLLGVVAHQPQPRHVRRRVEAEVRLRALRLQQVVAALPRADDVGADARAAADLTDAEQDV